MHISPQSSFYTLSMVLLTFWSALLFLHKLILMVFAYIFTDTWERWSCRETSQWHRHGQVFTASSAEWIVIYLPRGTVPVKYIVRRKHFETVTSIWPLNLLFNSHWNSPGDKQKTRKIQCLLPGVRKLELTRWRFLKTIDTEYRNLLGELHATTDYQFCMSSLLVRQIVNIYL